MSSRQRTRGNGSSVVRERRPGDALRFDEHMAASLYALRNRDKAEAGQICFDHVSHVPYVVQGGNVYV